MCSRVSADLMVGVAQHLGGTDYTRIAGMPSWPAQILYWTALFLNTYLASSTTGVQGNSGKHLMGGGGASSEARDFLLAQSKLQ